MLMRKKIFLALAISAAAVSLFFTANFIRATSSPGMARERSRLRPTQEHALELCGLSHRRANRAVQVRCGWVYASDSPAHGELRKSEHAFAPAITARRAGHRAGW